MAVFRDINLGWRSPVADAIFWFLSYTGLGWVQILASLLLLRWPKTRRFTIPLLLSVALTGIAFAQGLKRLVIDRDRPSMMSWSVVQENFHHSSFPSGHTTTAFAVATILTLMTVGTRRGWVGAVAMLWAFGVGVSRVYRGVHWPSDALAGACAGAFGAGIIYLVSFKLGWLDLDPVARWKGRADLA